MLRNTQISHILLLCVIALVIYQLCKPKNIKNEGTVEPITNHSSEEIVDEEHEEEHEHDHDEVFDSEVNMNGIVTELEEDENKVEKVVSSGFKEIETDGGASIDTAFEAPVERNASTTVDFNKNMVTEFDSKEYLPAEENNSWFDTSFSMAQSVDKYHLINTEKYVIGVDTVGQSLKNPTYDLRGTIANPKYNVSPWGNSTYEPDYNVKPLC
jgi:hypothetical protein